jgi:hypothetical protein
MEKYAAELHVSDPEFFLVALVVAANELKHSKC